MKKCSKCKEEKDVTEFYRNKSQPGGRANQCKKCTSDRKKCDSKHKEYQKNYREANKEKHKEYCKGYYENNREDLLAKSLKYEKENKKDVEIRKKKHYEANKDAVLKNNREYYSANKNSINERSKEYQKENREYINARNKNRRLNDEIYRAKCSIRNTVCKSIKRKHFSKRTSTLNMIGCDYAFFKKYIEQLFQEGMSWDNYGEWEYDHIIPIASAKTIDEIETLNHYTNFQPLWWKDNRSKGCKILN